MGRTRSRGATATVQPGAALGDAFRGCPGPALSAKRARKGDVASSRETSTSTQAAAGVAGRARGPGSGFWVCFNDWWRHEVELAGQRPTVEAICKWHAAHAARIWAAADAPTARETARHAASLRTTSEAMERFRGCRYKGFRPWMLPSGPKTPKRQTRADAALACKRARESEEEVSAAPRGSDSDSGTVLLPSQEGAATLSRAPSVDDEKAKPEPKRGTQPGRSRTPPEHSKGAKRKADQQLTKVVNGDGGSEEREATGQGPSQPARERRRSTDTIMGWLEHVSRRPVDFCADGRPLASLEDGELQVRDRLLALRWHLSARRIGSAAGGAGKRAKNAPIRIPRNEEKGLGCAKCRQAPNGCNSCGVWPEGAVWPPKKARDLVGMVESRKVIWRAPLPPGRRRKVQRVELMSYPLRHTRVGDRFQAEVDDYLRPANPGAASERPEPEPWDGRGEGASVAGLTTEQREWSTAEIGAFGDALYELGKDFKAISRAIGQAKGCKNIAQCVRFYYDYWKHANVAAKADECLGPDAHKALVGPNDTGKKSRQG